ncbi:MAG: hypothetical protein J6W82_09645 [Bacteroidales bacterium]|nr:hypothetical protein [Bacteroidales bacterium]
MESILGQLESQAVWEEFLAHRLMKGRFTWPLFEHADAFVSEERYLPAVRSILRGEGPSIPERKCINKMGSGKKRTVYSFGSDETRVLKLISYLLYRYDGCFAPNCYSFRRGLKAADAIFSLRKALRGRRMWAYKTDIHDYFNSIPIPLLLPILKGMMSDDPELYGFFERLLDDDRALVGGEVVHGRRGVMAGTPTAPFLADVYLMEVDRHFADAGVVYARYSDDLILFAPDRETLESHKAALLDFLSGYGLEINPDKERIYSPDEPFEFLGFKCLGSSIDISEATKRKMKGRIRRAAHSIARWRHRKGLDVTRAMKGLIRTFNNKFFEDDDPEALTWSRWFFPVINRTEGLKEIDNYLQQYIRFLSTGRHTKANYRVRYADLKALGYRSLVHEYYLFQEQVRTQRLVTSESSGRLEKTGVATAAGSYPSG